MTKTTLPARQGLALSPSDSRPPEPNLPPLIAPLLHSAVEFVGSGLWREVPSLAAVTLDHEQRGEAGEYLYQVDQYLAPGDTDAMALRVKTLLAHWPARDQDEVVAAMVAVDWLRHLGRFPLWAVDECADNWISMEQRRPTVADIRMACDIIVGKHALRAKVLRRWMEVD